MAITDNILGELQSNSILATSLHGVRTLLERELGLKNLLLATDDTIMGEFTRKAEQLYPHSYLVINELIGVTDQIHTRYVQRQGVTSGLGGATKATTQKAYMFPINVGVELKYQDNDMHRVMAIAEALVIFSMIGGLSFTLTVSGIEYIVRIEIPLSTSIPIGSAESANDPSATEVSVSMVIHTHAGFFRDVSAVQSGSATTSYTIAKI